MLKHEVSPFYLGLSVRDAAGRNAVLFEGNVVKILQRISQLIHGFRIKSIESQFMADMGPLTCLKTEKAKLSKYGPLGTPDFLSRNDASGANIIIASQESRLPLDPSLVGCNYQIDVS
jgi:hypothetical protein